MDFDYDADDYPTYDGEPLDLDEMDLVSAFEAMGFQVFVVDEDTMFPEYDPRDGNWLPIDEEYEA